MFDGARGFLCGGAVLIALGLFAASVHADGTICDLGALGGTFSASEGFAVSATGQVVGDSFTADFALHQAFIYTGTPGNGGTMSGLGTLGGLSSSARSINASGQIAGWTTTLDNAGTHAFVYTGIPGVNGQMVDLGTLGGTQSYGSAINDCGQITGRSSTVGDAEIHAFRYTGTPGTNGSMSDLGTLGGKFSFGSAINAQGQVAGYSSPPGNNTEHAFLYTGILGDGGVMTDLGTLGGDYSSASAINANGQVTGYSYLKDDGVNDTPIHAFLYTGTPGSDGSMADLGSLGGTQSYGDAISDGARIVGTSLTTDDAAWHAFLYSGMPGVDGQMIDLDAWLDTVNPTEGAKWTLEEAYGMTDTGLITGIGIYDDGSGGLSDGFRAYVLDASALLPEPGCLSLLGLAALAMQRWRRTAEQHGA